MLVCDVRRTPRFNLLKLPFNINIHAKYITRCKNIVDEWFINNAKRHAVMYTLTSFILLKISSHDKLYVSVSNIDEGKFRKTFHCREASETSSLIL